METNNPKRAAELATILSRYAEILRRVGEGSANESAFFARYASDEEVLKLLRGARAIKTLFEVYGDFPDFTQFQKSRWLMNSITVDLRPLSKDTRAMLRWVARVECATSDDDREESEYDFHLWVDHKLLRRVDRKIRRMRFRLSPEEAECLRKLIESVGNRLGKENLKDVEALMEGDDEAFLEEVDFLPYQPHADREKQGKELDRLHERLSESSRRGAA